LLGGPGRTSPGRVGFDNPDCPVGLISTIRLDLTFDQTSYSSQVFRRPFGTLLMPLLTNKHPAPLGTVTQPDGILNGAGQYPIYKALLIQTKGNSRRGKIINGVITNARRQVVHPQYSLTQAASNVILPQRGKEFGWILEQGPKLGKLFPPIPQV